MRDEQTTNIEDRATQPMEAGGWVSQFVNVSCDSSKVEAGSGETGSSWFSDGSQRRGLEGGLFALPGPWVTILYFIVTMHSICLGAVQLKNTTSNHLSNLFLCCSTEEYYFHIRPYDEELLELLLMLEASEKSGEGGWESLARKQAGGENHRSRDNLRGEDRLKEEIDFWPQQQMVSNQVRVLALLLCHTLLP